MAYVSRVVEASKYYQCYKCTFKVINMINEIGVAGLGEMYDYDNDDDNVGCHAPVVLSLLGNGVVLLISFRRRKRMVGSELLFVNLAVVDFLCCVCFYPLSIVSSFSHAWLGQGLTCVYYGLGCYAFGLCGMFTVAAISVIRYLKTCYRLVYGERGTFGGVGGGCGVLLVFGVVGWGCRLSNTRLRIGRPKIDPPRAVI